MLAAAVAMYSFLEFGNTLDQITQRRVPSAMALLDVPRQAERLIAVTPELLAVASPDEHAEVSERIDAQIERLDASLADLKTSAIDPAALQEIEANANWLRLDSINLGVLVDGKLIDAEDKTDRLVELRDVPRP